jgi:membrane protein required for colicin V production
LPRFPCVRMNYFDLIIIVVLLWSAYRGITRGFIIMAASLAALILGIWGAIRFSDLTAGLLTRQFDIHTQYLGLIAFALTFIAIVIVVHLIARAADKLLKAVALGFVNRLLGLVFAVLKNAFILSIILVVLNAIDQRTPFLPEEQVENSILYKPLSKLAPAVFPYLNFEDIRQEFRQENNTQREV